VEKQPKNGKKSYICAMVTGKLGVTSQKNQTKRG